MYVCECFNVSMLRPTFIVLSLELLVNGRYWKAFLKYVQAIFPLSLCFSSVDTYLPTRRYQKPGPLCLLQLLKYSVEHDGSYCRPQYKQ